MIRSQVGERPSLASPVPRYRTLLLLAGLVLAATASATAQEFDTPLVDADWLQDNIDDPSVVVLHAGGTEEDFAEGHIPSAQHLPRSAIAWDGENGARVEFRSPEELAEAFGSRGVSNDSRIVIVGHRTTDAARTWVTLDWLGLGGQAAILNGGLVDWEAAGGEVASGPAATVAARSLTLPTPPADFRVSSEWIADRLGDEAVALLDARNAAQFSGEDDGGLSRAGHIPGAQHLDWVELVDSENPWRFLSVGDLEGVFNEHGAEEGTTVVAYCRTGVRGSVDYFVARLLGRDVRFYDGSWTEWSAQEDLPVETGNR